MAMCGHAFWSHDIGGFIGHPTHELFMRWAQFGLLSPMTRAHGNSTRLPWEFGPEALDNFRNYARLRYSLLPYIYSYATIAAQTSLPIMRPMVLEYPDDPSTFTMDLQYMFGEELLIAPIYNVSGRRAIYLPAGCWIDFWSHEIIDGPRSIHVQPDLTTIPMYIKANALIPTIKPAQHTTEEPFEGITVDAYLLDQGTFTLYDTDGLTTISAALADDHLKIHIDGSKHQLSVRLIPLSGQPPVTTVTVNGDDDPPWIRKPDGSILVSFDAS